MAQSDSAQFRNNVAILDLKLGHVLTLDSLDEFFITMCILFLKLEGEKSWNCSYKAPHKPSPQ